MMHRLLTAINSIILLTMILSFCLQAESADSAPDPRKPAAIETQEVPPVPAELQAKLAQYQNMRAASFAGWDPKGTGILIRTRFGNTAQLHRVYEPRGRREQITFFDEPVDGRFSFDGIVLSMGSGGNENSQIYLLDLENFKTTLLTDGKSRNTIQPLDKPISRLVIGSNKRNGRDTDLYIMDPEQPGKLKMLMEVKNEFWSAEAFSPDTSLLVLKRTVSANESYLAVINYESGKRTDLPPMGADKAAYGPMTYGLTEDYFFVVTDANGEFAQLYRKDCNQGTYENLTADIPWDVSDLALNGRTGQLAFTVNADGISRLFFIDKPYEKKVTYRELEIPQQGIISSLEFSPNGKRLGFTLARPDAPADVHSVGEDGIVRWTYSEVGGLNPASFVTPTRIRFKSFDDREIPAHVYKPKNASEGNRAPVLINIHGGPEGQAQPYFTGATQFYVNELGIAVIYPNVRGSIGYGKTYLKLDNAEKREDSVKDIGALLDWIAQQPDLDKDRVAVTGGSYGGYMVLASLVNFPDRIKAGIDAVGIANFNTFLQQTSAYRQDLRRVEYGDERDPKMKAFFEKISPANRVDQIKSDLLVIHGKNDPRAPFTEAQQIAAKVREKGRPVWTVYAANEGHGFGKKENVDYLRAVEVMFLKKSFGIE
jgi:dipeptidyl aminopeptidase/acylaminoacyl peptidase